MFPYEQATFWMVLLLLLSAAYAAYKAKQLADAAAMGR